MSISSTTPLLPPNLPIISKTVVHDIETKLNYIFRDKSYLLQALGAQESTFWTSVRAWSNTPMLRSSKLDKDPEALLRAARYLGLERITVCKDDEERSNDTQTKTVKRVLLAVYMDGKDQRLVHHAANHLGLYIAYPFKTTKIVAGAGVEFNRW
ncbi:uncharacterized protein M421DRAFT_2826 [Didymella exigua CBS 183.55]|uniref:RNase III domain-containing protein n=1 Tax=Didymella exigua CBS 183.55 TaxID=1150837 RepID=A0A6A5RYE9_9PLEO|nr:uncharacterized protein M421DRAFT_2826 [Didymella exigua CBS 183.55]KAF1931326.1 hypothetical protein M421DRAFT_2826 [Didymella exigua CBS 183.55]